MYHGHSCPDTYELNLQILTGKSARDTYCFAPVRERNLFQAFLIFHLGYRWHLLHVVCFNRILIVSGVHQSHADERLTNNSDDKNARTLKLLFHHLSHHICMKNAHTRKALADAMIIAIGNANAAGKPSIFPFADVTTVRIVRKIKAKKTANSIFGGAGWQNDGRSS